MSMISATTTQEIELAPETKIKLLSAITAYEALRGSINELITRRSVAATIIEDIQVALGQSTIEVDGYKSTIVAGTTKSFDAKRFVALGGDITIYHAAMVERPKKAYVRITTPGQSEGDE